MLGRVHPARDTISICGVFRMTENVPISFLILTSVTVCTFNLIDAQLMYTSVDGTFADAEAKSPPPFRCTVCHSFTIMVEIRDISHPTSRKTESHGCFKTCQDL